MAGAEGKFDSLCSAEVLPQAPKKKLYSLHGVQLNVDPEYMVETLLGRGTSGFVFRATDRRTLNKVAVKRYSKLFEYGVVEAQRALQELRILARCRHRNVLHLNGIMTFDAVTFQEVYLVTELFDRDLASIIHSRTVLTEEHRAYFAFQMLSGLQYLHNGNIMHRDVKPGNMLVQCSDCRLVLSDFGHSAYEASGVDGNATQYVVTRHYRAPELLLSAPYSKAVDVWAAGLVLAEVLARRVVLPGSDYLNQLLQVLDFVGTPSPEDTQFLPEASREVLSQLPVRPPLDLKAAFRNSSQEAVSLLQVLLCFNPQKRLTAEEALRHPYFRAFSWEEDTFKPDDTMDIANLPTTEPALRAAFLAEEKRLADGLS